MSSTPRRSGGDGGTPAPGPELDAVRAALDGASTTMREASEPPALAALLARVQRQVASERGVAARLRALPTPRRALLALTGIALLIALGGAASHGPRGPSSALRVALELALPAMLLLVAVTTALRPIHRPRLPAWRARLADVVPYLVLLGLCFVPDLLTPSHGARVLIIGSMPCLVIGVASATAAFALVQLLDRDTSGSSFAAIGAAALAAHITLSVLCPTTAALHLVAGHYGAVLVFAAAVLARAAWLGRGDSTR